MQELKHGKSLAQQFTSTDNTDETNCHKRTTPDKQFRPLIEKFTEAFRDDKY